jgi:biotin carboxyl carrier protein
VNYEVAEKQGASVRVGLRETGEGLYEISLDGKTVHVDAVRSGPNIYSIIEDGQQFEAMVDERGAHGFDVLVGGRIFHLEVLDERSQLLAGSAAVIVSGPQTVLAEMPGKIVKVNVVAGAEVRERQGIVIVEAMKMENEIPSPIDGIVREIAVSEGQTVEAGATLFVVEPPPRVRARIAAGRAPRSGNSAAAAVARRNHRRRCRHPPSATPPGVRKSSPRFRLKSAGEGQRIARRLLGRGSHAHPLVVLLLLLRFTSEPSRDRDPARRARGAASRAAAVGGRDDRLGRDREPGQRGGHAVQQLLRGELRLGLVRVPDLEVRGHERAVRGVPEREGGLGSAGPV